MKRVYFDYAASTPVDPRVEKAMRPYFLKKFGNAGSLHSFGQEASSAMDNGREIIAKAINADFREVVFTGSATEANNLALRGAIAELRGQIRGTTRTDFRVSQREVSVGQRPKLIVSAVEHESVLETARDLAASFKEASLAPLGRESDGIEVVYLPVDRNGIVKLDALKSALDERTILVSVMYANNEIGVIQPIAEIAKIIKEFSSTNNESGTNQRIRKFETHSLFGDRYPLFHTDAVQAFQFLDCDVNRLGVDMMTLSAHKIYGPKGIGALYVRGSRVQGIGYSKKNSLHPNPYTLTPVITGGNQEFGLRSGTENIPSIVGFAKAVELSVANREPEFQRIKRLKDYFWNEILKMYPRAEINGPDERKEKRTKNNAPTCLPNILNIYFPDHEAQYLLVKFDLAGIAVSAGSACSARSAQPSYVITSLGFPEKRAKQSIRFSFGRQTTQKDIDSALGVIRKLL